MWTQGERFGTIGCRRGGWDFEITTHRAEAYTPDSRKPEVVFADAVEADLSRRDFTVNAMALSLPDPELVDPFGGAADLAAGRLRTPLSPEESFGDDPLADVAGRALHSRLWAAARPGADRRGRAHALAPRDRVGRADP